MISVIKIVEDTTVDGPGFRTTVYAAGCPNACPGCHNPQSWDIGAGRMMSTDEIMAVIRADEFADVTFSGGDPMFQPEGFAELAKAIKNETGKNIWCYTGYTFEHLCRDDRQSELLQWIDVLVDGPYVESQRDRNILFRGSRNQRLIDVQASLRKGSVILYAQ
ncbi:MAG: anaerobic ribonucleoside-triphosphate reductase activating protein [Paraprevotella sp.]|nr:anaerobic ribonucleoside-triphosphate reductase activating protein [Paraprevotella sp.]